jgi:hypothetical protein
MEDRLTRATAIALLLAATACGEDPSKTPARPIPGDKKMISTALELVPDGERWSITFSLRNTGARELTAQIVEPFLQYELEVTTRDGARLSVAQPAFNVPGRPRALVLPAGATVQLQTPIRLRFDPNVPPSGGPDPMVWSIRGPRQPVRVRATFELPGLGAQVADGHID